jgi:ABC-type glutathione transport system ATPase component
MTIDKIDAMLCVQDVTKVFGHGHEAVRALDDVTLCVHRGEALGVVGESGSGKTTLSRIVLGIEHPTSGTVEFRGTELSALDRNGMRQFRHAVTAVFQNPYSSLDPRMHIWRIITEQMSIERRGTKKEKEDRAAELLERVGLQSGMLRRYPHQLSGGQRQRVAIARALVCDPELIMLDEATSALDVSVRAQILNLLLDLQEEFGLTYVFIAHDLALIRHLCQRTVVMRHGKVIEQRATADLFRAPEDPYTAELIEASQLGPNSLAERDRVTVVGPAGTDASID